jgi:hypothetical protein
MTCSDLKEGGTKSWIEIEEIHKYLKKAKNGKVVGIDGYPMEFWKELCKKENIVHPEEE